MRLEWDVKKKQKNRSKSEGDVPDTDTCETQPHFATDSSGDAQAVILDKSSYVKLLIDARITDEDCWPPGLEKCATLLARLVEIEETGISKHGAFIPEKLSRRLQNEYFKLNMALDEIQNELQEELSPDTAEKADGTPTKSEEATGFTPPISFAKFASELAARQHEYKTWEEYPTIHNNEHFA